MKMIIRPNMYFADIYAGSCVFEPDSIGFMRQNVKPGMVALDIGANVGYFTLLLAKLTGALGRVYAFEPSLSTSNLLRENVSLNGITNVEIHQVALSEEAGFLELMEGPEGYEVYNTVTEVLHPAARTVEFTPRTVRAITIDEFLLEKGITRIDFIKIDVEGAEYSVLKGMRQTLEASVHMSILFEWTDMIDDSISLKSITSLLSGFGFTCYTLAGDGRIHPINDSGPQRGHMFVAKK